jgi:hypothetical protein
MQEYNELTNIMYAIGTQLYGKDKILYDLFEDRFKHSYVTFSYCSGEKDKIEQLELIKELKNKYTLIELVQLALQYSDYYTSYQINWWISNYEDKIKKYDIQYKPIIKTSDIEKSFNNRLMKLKTLGLGSWRKSNDNVLHNHYLYWINHLMSDEVSYSLWAFQYNDTRFFDTFHLTNCSNKQLSNIILQYILDNHIIPHSLEKDNEITIMHPFIFNSINDSFTIKYSSNMGGMWYMIYLTAKELQEIYKDIGSKKARNMNVMPFFSYVNSLKSDYEADTKFYLYFKN